MRCIVQFPLKLSMGFSPIHFSYCTLLLSLCQYRAFRCSSAPSQGGDGKIFGRKFFHLGGRRPPMPSSMLTHRRWPMGAKGLRRAPCGTGLSRPSGGEVSRGAGGIPLPLWQESAKLRYLVTAELRAQKKRRSGAFFELVILPEVGARLRHSNILAAWSGKGASRPVAHADGMGYIFVDVYTSTKIYPSCCVAAWLRLQYSHLT